MQQHLTVNDKLALVVAAEKKFKAQSAKAQEKLAEAEALLSKLTKAERERLAKLAAQEEDADQANSQAAARALVWDFRSRRNCNQICT